MACLSANIQGRPIGSPRRTGHVLGGVVGTIFRTVVAVVAPLFVWSGLLSSGTAEAEPVPVADVTQAADTDDGWHLSAELTKMTVNSVPNMAATPLTREAFVTGKA